MVFVPRSIESEPVRRTSIGQIVQVGLLFLLVGGWGVVSGGWAASVGVREFASFAFLLLMSILFIVVGWSYRGESLDLALVYSIPSIFFLMSVAMYFSLTPGYAMLQGLFQGQPVWHEPAILVLLGVLFVGVYAMAFFSLGAKVIGPYEAIFTLLSLAWVCYLVFLPSLSSSIAFVNTTFVLISLMLLSLSSFTRKEYWLIGLCLFFLAVYAGIKLVR